MPIPHRRVRGKIHYTSDKPDRKGQERGREYFTITVHGDGSSTLRAFTEIDDAPNVMRDVTLSRGPDRRPTDCFVRLSVGDEFRGSSWYRFTETEASCEGFTTHEGRISQRFALQHPLVAFGTHPIQGDAWLTNIVDISRGPTPPTYHQNVMMCSLDHRGATGPALMPHPKGVNLRFVGRERITVRAGTFEALHFRYAETTDDGTGETRNEPGKHPPYDLWCTDDDDRVMLLAYVTGYMMTRYELTEYEQIPASR
jgi:hypothetical protein